MMKYDNVVSTTPSPAYNVYGQPGATQRNGNHALVHNVRQSNKSKRRTQTHRLNDVTASTPSLAMRPNRVKTAERNFRFLQQKYAILKKSHSSQRIRIMQARQRERQLTAELHRKDDEKRAAEKKIVEWCKKTLQDSAELQKRALMDCSTTIRQLEQANQNAEKEICELKRKLEKEECVKAIDYNQSASKITARLSEDSGVENDELPGEDDNVVGCRSTVTLVDFAADEDVEGDERFSAPALGASYKYLIIHKHKDLRLRGYDGAEMRFSSLDAMQDTLLTSSTIRRVHILQLVYMRIGRRVVDFIQDIMDRNQRFFGVSLQILDFAQHAKFFDILLTDLLHRTHTLHIRNVRGVTVTPAVLNMLSCPTSSIDYLHMQYFSDVCRRPIRFTVNDIIAYLHHNVPGRKRILHLYDDNVASSGDVTQTFANQCKVYFKEATKPSQYCFRLKSKAKLLYRNNKLRYEEYRNVETGELLQIWPLKPGPADNFRRAILIRRRCDNKIRRNKDISFTNGGVEL